MTTPPPPPHRKENEWGKDHAANGECREFIPERVTSKAETRIRWIRREVRDGYALSNLSGAVSTASGVAVAFDGERVLGETVVATFNAHHNRSCRDTGVDETQVAPPTVVLEHQPC